MDYSIQIESYKNFAIKQPEKIQFFSLALVELPSRGDEKIRNKDYGTLDINIEFNPK
jgi:hypothetical protein